MINFRNVFFGSFPSHFFFFCRRWSPDYGRLLKYGSAIGFPQLNHFWTGCSKASNFHYNVLHHTTLQCTSLFCSAVLSVTCQKGAAQPAWLHSWPTGEEKKKTDTFDKLHILGWASIKVHLCTTNWVKSNFIFKTSVSAD